MVARADRRRETRRLPSGSLARVRVRAGSEALVLDYSTFGVLLCLPTRLLPGQPCVLSWPGFAGTPSSAGRVVRSAVSSVTSDGGLVYRAAVAFEVRAGFLSEVATQHV